MYNFKQFLTGNNQHHVEFCTYFISDDICMVGWMCILTGCVHS